MHGSRSSAGMHGHGRVWHGTLLPGVRLRPATAPRSARPRAWTIYDFGLTHANVNAARREHGRVGRRRSHSTALDVRLAVENAYLQAVAYRRLVIVAQTTVKSELGHVDQAKRFVAAQAKDPIEVAQAEATLANAQSAEALGREQRGRRAREPALRDRLARSGAPAGRSIRTGRHRRRERPATSASTSRPRASIGPTSSRSRRTSSRRRRAPTAAHAERRPTLGASGIDRLYARDRKLEPAADRGRAGLTLSWALWDGGQAAPPTCSVANANEIAPRRSATRCWSA